MPKVKETKKTVAAVSLDGKLFTQLTKVEVAPMIAQGRSGDSTYAITLRFCVTSNFEFPPFQPGLRSRLTVKQDHLPNTFEFAVEFLDLGIESNCNFTELTCFLRGKRVDNQPMIVGVERPVSLVI